jgi:glycosyltransferase involved in cell wall biosynthesis
MIYQPSRKPDVKATSWSLSGGESLLPRGVNLCGYLRTESGVGAAARAYVRALEKAEIPLALLDISDLQTNRSQDGEIPRFDDDHPFDINLICADVELHFSILSHFGDDFFRNRYNIGIWAWELPRFPKKWFDRFAYYDEIWIASSFIAESLATVAPIPIVRMPPPLVMPKSGSRERGRERLGVNEDEFLFLFAFDVHSHIERKNPAAAIEAFRRAFSPADSARLVLKCVNGGANPDGLDQLRQLAHGARVEIHDGYWSADEMRDLMAACDAYVSLHRSEGTGLTITDAMALGKPVIATGWSGNTDFMNVGNSFPISYELVEIKKSVGPYQAGQTWAEPNVEYAAECMRAAYDDREAALARGRAAKRDIETQYSEQAVGERIIQRLETVGIRRRWPEFQRQIYERLDEYQRLPEQIRQTVHESLPAGVRVAVVSKGDERLIELGDYEGWHFPQADDGVYSGYYPADTHDAIDQLQRLQAKGAEFLLFPNSAFWWLEKYDGLADYLAAQYAKIADGEHCILYELEPGRASLGRLERELERLREVEQEIRQLAPNKAAPRPSHPSNGARGAAPATVSKKDSYQQLIASVQNIVESVVPKGSYILVISKGDPRLLDLRDRTAAHFPQSKSGGYAGHHPADSAAAIAQLDALRRDEASYLLIPATAYWWLGHYVEFRRHLEERYQRFWNDDNCTIYDLSPRSQPHAAQENGNGHVKASLLARLRNRLAISPVTTNGRGHA